MSNEDGKLAQLKESYEQLKGMGANQEVLNALRKQIEGLGGEADLPHQVDIRGGVHTDGGDFVARDKIDVLKANYTANMDGDGAIAQGNGTKAVGQKGVLAEGNVQDSIIATGDNITINHNLPKGASPKALRTAYLRQLYDSASPLALAGVDRKSASEAEVRLSLSAIYTALMTFSTDEKQSSRMFGEEKGGGEPSTRQLSALDQLNRYNRLVILGEPGSGKSTFVNFVVLCLAGESLGAERVNLKLLTAPIPQDEDGRHSSKNEPVPQPWDHGALLPVQVILRDFAARGLPPAGQKASAEHLWKFIVSELKSCAMADFVKPLKKELLENGGLFLVDGLDEVPEAEHRREQIRQALDEFASVFGKCRFLVTSRTYAYQKQDWKLHNFEETVLAPFSRSQVERFVDGWYEHIAIVRKLDMPDARGKAELLKQAIRNSDRLMALAERPLLLTLMASLHAWRGGTLPEKREELYADTVDLLLDWWESQRVMRDHAGKPVNIQPSLAEWLKVDRQKVRDLLNQLAFEAHFQQDGLTGTADVAEKELLAGMIGLSQNPDVKPARLLEYLRDRAGLLMPRGVGVYTFPHRTFQEYLAACYLTDHGYPEDVAQYCRGDPNRWREVALLAGAKAARGGAFALWPLVDALSPESDQCGKEACAWGAQIAGQAILEIADIPKIGEANRPKVARVRDRLLDIMEGGRLPAIERARAGNTLAALGDPRFDPEHWYLPREENFGFVRIPAGKFIMGSDCSEDEKPQHDLELPYDYWMAKYPVTVAQYRAFVAASGHKTLDKDSMRSVANHPVVRITWQDALGYSKWLSGQLAAYSKEIPNTSDLFWQGLAAGKLRVTLPSEAEWEKAARGRDGSTYPWGEKPDPNLANFGETGIGTTSAVGAFPEGKSPYGLLDMSGNIWEWTRTIFDEKKYKYKYRMDDGREDLHQKDALRVLRGGAFYNNGGSLRCAYRNWYNPYDWYYYFGFRVMVSPVSSK